MNARHLAVAGGAALVLTAVVIGPPTMAGHPAPAFATCADDLGETPGQAFPCYWPGGGRDEAGAYVLISPDCDVYCATQGYAFGTVRQA